MISIETKSQEISDRFWAKVQKTENCWIWVGAKQSKGYGSFVFQGQAMTAHRVAWLLCFGEIPEGMFICHKCDNRLCVNPAHLFLGTNSDNMRDAVSKGRLGGIHNHTAKINWSLAAFIRSLSRDLSVSEIARLLGLGYRLVWDVVHFRTWKEVSNESQGSYQGKIFTSGHGWSRGGVAEREGGRIIEAGTDPAPQGISLYSK